MARPMKRVVLQGGSTGRKKIVRVGQNIRWHQRGLNRYLEGKVIKIENPYKYKNTNEYTITVKLKSGAIVKTRGWQLL